MRKARVVLLLVIIFVLSQTRMSVHGVPVSAAVLHMHGPVETATTMRWMKLSLSLSPSFSLLFKLFCASLCYPYEHRTDFSSDLRDDSRTDMKRVIICLHLSL